METIKEIVTGTIASLTRICNGKLYYWIQTNKHLYQLEINCNDDEWKNVDILPEFKTLTLMRWIRKGIDNNDETFIMLN